MSQGLNKCPEFKHTSQADENGMHMNGCQGKLNTALSIHILVTFSYRLQHKDTQVLAAQPNLTFTRSGKALDAVEKTYLE